MPTIPIPRLYILLHPQSSLERNHALINGDILRGVIFYLKLVLNISKKRSHFIKSVIFVGSSYITEMKISTQLNISPISYYFSKAWCMKDPFVWLFTKVSLYSWTVHTHKHSQSNSKIAFYFHQRWPNPFCFVVRRIVSNFIAGVFVGPIAKMFSNSSSVENN